MYKQYIQIQILTDLSRYQMLKFLVPNAVIACKPRKRKEREPTPTSPLVYQPQSAPKGINQPNCADGVDATIKGDALHGVCAKQAANAAGKAKRGKCPHGRQRCRCKECGGVSICEHGRIRRQYRECGGGDICLHGGLRSQCRECGGESFAHVIRRNNNEILYE